MKGRRILLGVSGSIAAYKAADLCSHLSRLGADIHVILTASAARFVGEATFRALTRNPVVSDVFDEPTVRRIAHIDLAQTADLVLVAPASADLLARMAHGLADDMLTTCLLATPPMTPVLVAPAMNTVMWEHPATVANVQTLVGRGIQIVAPDNGLLACQDTGTGRLAPVETIVAAVHERLSPHEVGSRLEQEQRTLPPASDSQNRADLNQADLNQADLNQADLNQADLNQADRNWKGVRLLVTAGATREPLDPVRFLSNRSSGKMGYAIAQAAADLGAQVTLVTGFATAPAPADVQIVRVQTAEEMLAACRAHFDAADVLIAAAAVADYAPETVQAQKIKKPVSATPADDVSEIVTLRLKRTPDVVASVACAKRPDQTVVGFAAETEDLLANARTKMARKGLDLIVANDVSAEGAGFESDTNIVTLLWPDGRVVSLPRAPKSTVARHILDAVKALHAAT